MRRARAAPGRVHPRARRAELNRILSHILFMGWLALDIGAITPVLYSFIERDEIVECSPR